MKELCEVCGFPLVHCECDECPVCGNLGKTECYRQEHMRYTPRWWYVLSAEVIQSSAEYDAKGNMVEAKPFVQTIIMDDKVTAPQLQSWLHEHGLKLRSMDALVRARLGLHQIHQAMLAQTLLRGERR